MLDFYTQLGFAVDLLSQSKYHSQRPFGPYLRNEILPALSNGQARFFVTDSGSPAALVTWAWLDGDTLTDLQNTGRSLALYEWNCGTNLFFNDWIAPYGTTHALFLEFYNRVFPEVNEATSLRRNPDGSVRRVNQWRRSGGRTRLRRAS